MIQALTLASGSSGNAAFITDGRTHILVDCGLTLKRLTRELERFDLTPGQLNAVLLTHEHSDHTGALKSFGRLNVPVYAAGGTLCEVKGRYGLSGEQLNEIGGTSFRLDGITVTGFPTSHDAADSRGYVFDSGGTRVGVCTDLGEMTEDAASALRGCEYVVLECNHDIHMLKNGSYPLFLRRRVMSRLGHLCNEDCAETVVMLAKAGLKRVTLAHMSEQNNDPSLALGAVFWALNSFDVNHGVEVDVAPRHEAGAVYSIN